MKKLVICCSVFAPIFLSARDYGRIGDAYPGGGSGDGGFLTIILFLMFLGLIAHLTDFIGLTDFSEDKAERKKKEAAAKSRKAYELKQRQFAEKQRKRKYLGAQEKKKQEQSEKERIAEKERAKIRREALAEKRKKQQAIDAKNSKEFQEVLMYIKEIQWPFKVVKEPADMPNCLLRVKESLRKTTAFKKQSILSMKAEMEMIEKGEHGAATIHDDKWIFGQPQSLFETNKLLNGLLEADEQLIREIDKEIIRIKKGEKRKVFRLDKLDLSSYKSKDNISKKTYQQ